MRALLAQGRDAGPRVEQAVLEALASESAVVSRSDWCGQTAYRSPYREGRRRCLKAITIAPE